MIEAIIRELDLSQDFLKDKSIQTIYFGGGTPSLLNASEIMRILDKVDQLYDISNLQECTLEANPDDLNSGYLRDLRSTSINRLSIGIQSFQEEDLKLMNRAHTSTEAEAAIKRSQDAGYVSMSCDLIFGMPTLSHEDLGRNIRKLVDWEVPHISAYSLTIEERTALHHRIKTGTFIPASEGHYEEQMKLTMRLLQDSSYEQYEISNYARDGHYAIHNTNYWKGISYLGIGPSAHSYRQGERKWNVRNNAQYLQSILKNEEIPYEQEFLTTTDQKNERILTTLRTMWGLDLNKYATDFGNDAADLLYTKAKKYIDKGLITKIANAWILSKDGKLIADQIASDLFEINE